MAEIMFVVLITTMEVGWNNNNKCRELWVRVSWASGYSCVAFVAMPLPFV